VHSDPQAVLLQQHALDHGWSSPDDLAIIAYDDEVAPSAEPPITALHPPRQHVGRLLVETMVARLTEGARRPVQRTYVLPELNARASTRSPEPLPASALTAPGARISAARAIAP
jgi:DNA-binding LacI/PurR family transcriptional regulator